MPLNKSTGNMYDWVTHTWNTVKGQCYHNCEYCYMKTWGKQSPIRFDEKELKTDLRQGNTIFVGNTNDMFAIKINDEWVRKTLNHCSKFDNTYVFQSKNTFGINRMTNYLPDKVIIGTTIETNRTDILFQISKAPLPQERINWMNEFSAGYYKFITIEPIMDFDLEQFVGMIIQARPNFVNIGADSKHHNLPEPSYKKIIALIDELKKSDIEVRKKINLKRLMQNETYS